MAENIYSWQNAPEMLLCLLAQRQEYNRVKMLRLSNTIATVAVGGVSVASTWYSAEWLTASQGIAGLTLALWTRHSSTIIKEMQQRAASIQQYFDVCLFSKALGGEISEWGELPLHSTIAESIGKVKRAKIKKLINWYNDYSKLTPEEQVFYCQRQNVRWNARLCRAYQIFYVVLFAIVPLLVVAGVAIIKNPCVVSFLCFILSALSLGSSVSARIQETAASVKYLKSLTLEYDSIETKIESVKPSKKDLIALQHKIKQSREASLPIPNWFYNIFRPNYQESENQIAKFIVATSLKTEEPNQ